MDRDDIIRMALEADPFGEHGTFFLVAALTPETLERFAAMVAAAEREKFTVHAAALVHDARRDATEREREACAKVADKWIGCDGLAAAIRARGEK